MGIKAEALLRVEMEIQECINIFSLDHRVNIHSLFSKDLMRASEKNFFNLVKFFKVLITN